MRDSVQLNSWDSFLVTLPSISSKTCAIYSSVIPGADATGCSWDTLVSNLTLLLIAAYFSMLPSSGKGSTVVKTEIVCNSQNNS